MDMQQRYIQLLQQCLRRSTRFMFQFRAFGSGLYDCQRSYCMVIFTCAVCAQCSHSPQALRHHAHALWRLAHVSTTMDTYCHIFHVLCCCFLTSNTAVQLSSVKRCQAFNAMTAEKYIAMYIALSPSNHCQTGREGGQGQVKKRKVQLKIHEGGHLTSGLQPVGC